jgi:hypothetical protein
MIRALVIAVLAGCGTAPPPALANTSAARAPLVVRAADITGALGFAPRPATTSPDDWLPLASAPGLYIPRAAAPPIGTALRAVPADATAPRVVEVGAAAAIPYGCEQQTLDVATVAIDAAVAPGVVLFLPARLPAGWAPRARPLTDRATAAARTTTAGAVAITTTRIDDARAHVAIAVAGRAVYAHDAARPAMEGDDGPAVDLRGDTPGIPRAIAVFELAPDGPVLVVLRTPGYEGVAFTTLLVDEDRATAVPALATYLYQCAF